MPTLPLHHGCLAQPLDRVEAVVLLDGHVLVGVDALRAAGAAHVEPDADEAALGEVVVGVVAALA